MSKIQATPIRIAHWGLFGGYGGTEMFIMNLYRKINRDKVQFDFLREHDAEHFSFEDEINNLGGRVLRVMYSKREAPLTSEKKLTSFFANHPEISGVHVHAVFPYASPLKAAKQANVGLRILHSHSAQSNVKLGFKEKIRNYLVNKEINTCPTHYFACSDSAAQWMFPDKPYQWIKNGIDTTKYAFSEEIRHQVRLSVGLDNNTTVLGFCGRLNDNKNPIRALDIFNEFHKIQPNSVFMIIGIGELYEKVKQRISQLHLPERSVIFMGGDRSDVNKLYQGMDAFVMPSHYEGLPLVLIEAQTAGLPCIASAEAVTLQAKVSDLLKFESLQNSNLQWAQQILHMLDEQRSRTAYADIIRSNGFDMSSTASYLEDFYLENAIRLR